MHAKGWIFWEISLKKICRYKLVIFTNQGGIEKGKQKPEDIKGKIMDMCKDLGFPIQAFVSPRRGLYRKPSTGMWTYFLKHCNGGIKPGIWYWCFGSSFCSWNVIHRRCSRAAQCKLQSLLVHGFTFHFVRVGNLARKKISRAVIEPLHIIYLFPFKHQKNSFWEKNLSRLCGTQLIQHNYYKVTTCGYNNIQLFWLQICVTPVVAAQPTPLSPKLLGIGKFKTEVVVMVGRPASGKSTITKRYFVPASYERINQVSPPFFLWMHTQLLFEPQSQEIQFTKFTESFRIHWRLEKNAWRPVRRLFLLAEVV